MGIGDWNALDFEAGLQRTAVVDADGLPMPVYHGTRGEFSAFESRRSLPMAEIGFWFTDSPDVAWMVALRKGSPGQARVLGAYLDIGHPLVFDEPGVDGLLALVRRISPRGEVTREAVAAFRRAVIEDGHDGLILRGVRADGGCADNFIAFRPMQILLRSVSLEPGVAPVAGTPACGRPVLPSGFR